MVAATIDGCMAVGTIWKLSNLPGAPVNFDIHFFSEAEVF